MWYVTHKQLQVGTTENTDAFGLSDESPNPTYNLAFLPVMLWCALSYKFQELTVVLAENFQ